MVLHFSPFFVKYLEVWTCFTWNNKRRMFLRLLSNHSVRKQKVKLLFIKTIRYSKNIKMSNYKPRLSVCLCITYRRPNRWSDRPQTWHVQRGRSRGCYRLGFKCLGSRRATKETEKGGRVSFGKLEKEWEIFRSSWGCEFKSREGRLFTGKAFFQFFYNIFSFWFKIKGR